MKKYYVNRDCSTNPNHNYEVHAEGCFWMPNDREWLGSFQNAVDAVKAAKSRGYLRADGCKHCCPEAHRG